jgi:hypothetical protein
MDVNPVTVLTSGVCALGARILVGEPLEGRPTRKVHY